MERRLRIPLDSGDVLVQVTSRAASIELIAPCGTFLDAYDSDETLARWADAAEMLPPPVQASNTPGALRYAAVRLHDPADTSASSAYDNTVFGLVRIDSSRSGEFLLTSTNSAWDCQVRLAAGQANALFAALRGHAASGALPYEFPTRNSSTGDRPHISGAWLHNQVDRPAERRSAGRPRYPPELRGSRLAGTVRLSFIIDSTGRARPSSIRLIGWAQPAFARAARAQLLQSRYRPAERNGRPVPVFAVQDYSFAEP
jgi:TonB family protein